MVQLPSAYCWFLPLRFKMVNVCMYVCTRVRAHMLVCIYKGTNESLIAYFKNAVTVQKTRFFSTLQLTPRELVYIPSHGLGTVQLRIFRNTHTSTRILKYVKHYVHHIYP
jgi:hypothetical protein